MSQVDKNWWIRLQDIIGPARMWPQWIRRLFWTTKLKYGDRMKLSSFVFINGGNSFHLVNCLKFTVPGAVNLERINQIYNLFAYWTGSTQAKFVIRERYYSYSLFYRKVLSLNCRKRLIL